MSRGKQEHFADLIRTYDDPILRRTCDPVQPGEATRFLSLLRKIVMATPNGVGIAAPQVGIAKRAAFLWPGRAGYGEYLINPVIAWHSPETDVAVEECLSYPGASAPVARWVRVIIRTERIDGSTTELTFAGFDARVALHELDHLAGVCHVGDAWRAQRDRAARTPAA